MPKCNGPNEGGSAFRIPNFCLCLSAIVGGPGLQAVHFSGTFLALTSGT